MDDVVIAARFNGPPGSANGGYASGTIARLLGGGAVEVRLRRPPPLDRRLRWDGARLLDGDEVVAEGSPVGLGADAGAGAGAGPGSSATGPPADLPPPVPVEAAHAASERFPGFVEHPFPTCFGCGPERSPGDGLRLFAGPVNGRDVVSAPWVPDPSLVVDGAVPLEVVWAALDCTGGWAGLAQAEGDHVLGTMRACVDRPPDAGRTHVVVGWHRGTEGRKLRSASALWTDSGDLLGWSEQIWIRLA